MNEVQANDYLVKEKVGKLMQKYSIPCIISLVVAALYNIVDQIFIANADYLGSFGNAANTVVYPLTVVALAISVLIGDGCCAFVSISLGAKKNEDAHKSVGNAILLCIISSIVLTAVYLIFMEPILTFFGGKVNEETYYYAKEYFFWISLGIPFYMFGQAMNPIIRSDGNPKFAMVATVIGQILTAGLSVWYLFHMRAVQLKKNSFGIWGRLMKKFLILGLTSFLAQISLVISMAAGCIPVVGYNIGANRKDRAKTLFTYLLIAEAAVGVIALLIVEILPSQLIAIFGAANESAYYTDFAIKSFRIYLCMMPLATVNKGTFIYLQALGKAVASTLISLAREIIFGVFLPIILPIFFGLDGILYSFPAADILTFVIALIVILHTYKELNGGRSNE